MHTLGPITRLQIQRAALKVGEKPNRIYDPAPLLAVERLRIEPDGIVATYQGAEVLDVHHRRHPESRNTDGLNGMSIGFTGHYALMAERFGEHLSVGCAGENLIVTCDRRVMPDELTGGLVILDAAGRHKLTVGMVQVAAPCRPFTGFALKGVRVPPEELKASLQALDNGVRGFYGVVTGVADVEIGDVIATAG